MKPQRLSLQEIWRVGCQGESLHSSDQDHFTKLARSRFHTFLMGMRHAASTTEQSVQESELLVSGIVRELEECPGLKTEWYRYHFADSTFGKKVSSRLEPAEGWFSRLMKNPAINRR